MHYFYFLLQITLIFRVRIQKKVKLVRSKNYSDYVFFVFFFICSWCSVRVAFIVQLWWDHEIFFCNTLHKLFIQARTVLECQKKRGGEPKYEGHCILEIFESRKCSILRQHICNIFESPRTDFWYIAKMNVLL